MPRLCSFSGISHPHEAPCNKAKARNSSPSLERHSAIQSPEGIVLSAWRGKKCSGKRHKQTTDVDNFVSSWHRLQLMGRQHSLQHWQLLSFTSLHDAAGGFGRELTSLYLSSNFRQHASNTTCAW